mgnify:CR=1 FL=1
MEYAKGWETKGKSQVEIKRETDGSNAEFKSRLRPGGYARHGGDPGEVEGGWLELEVEGSPLSYRGYGRKGFTPRLGRKRRPVHA